MIPGPHHNPTRSVSGERELIGATSERNAVRTVSTSGGHIGPSFAVIERR